MFKNKLISPIIMLSKIEKKNIAKLFKSLNKTDEFEIMFNNYRNQNKLSIVNFIKVLKYLKWRSDNENIELTNTTTLDIIYCPNTGSVYRVSITSLDTINEFLNLVHKRKNHVIYTILMTQFLTKKNFVLIKKTKDKKDIIDLDHYNIRIRKAKEESVDTKTINNLANLPLSQADRISFRFKQRISLNLINTSTNFI